MESVFDRIPDVSFIERINLDDEREKLIKDYQDKYMELTGISNYSLPAASPYRAILNAVVLHIYQSFIWLDHMGKMNLLKYAYGEYLDEIGIMFGVQRKQGEKAKTVIRFIVSAARTSNITIPIGTRCTNGNRYFLTTKVAEIKAGNTYVDVDVECSEIGKSGNGILEGEINVLVDSIAYISQVKNLNTTAYGTDIEEDEDLRERIYKSTSSFSVAGPEGAYIYFAKEYSSLVADVKVTNPSPRVVDIRVVLKNGVLPDESFCSGLKEYLSAEDRRPLTDFVNVSAPKQTSYNIDLTYYINSSDKANATAIQKAVNEAINTYIAWQGSKIGRDINPSQLVRLMLNAGAKRVDVRMPSFSTVADTDLAFLKDKTITYGGLEDD